MPAQLIMTQHQIDLHRAEWLKLRSASIGGSDIGVLLGLAPKSHGNPFSLYVEKKTGESITGDNDEMERGRELEPIVANSFAELRPDLLVLPGGLYRDEKCPWMTASLDRLTVSREALSPQLLRVLRADPAAALGDLDPNLLTPAELKTALSRNDPATGIQVWGEEYTDEIPVHIKAQALWQMQIRGCDRVLVPVKFMGNWKTALYVVQRTEDAQADIEFMVAEAAAFMDRLDRDDPPDLDWTPETAKALRYLVPLQEETVYRAGPQDAKRLRSAYRKMKADEKKYGLLQNRLAAKAGGAQKIVIADPVKTDRDGNPLDVTVMDRRQFTQHRIDPDKLRKDHPRIAGLVETTTDVDAWYPGQRWMNL
jgi:putative phage-type endonuclease